ncbi:MAG: hypothetical protein JO326_11425 [Acetobacteraceae bacterium]|nr:hypothetical protein [Acetobacteraceae bacterium]
MAVQPTPRPQAASDVSAARRRGRNIALAVALLALVVLFYAIAVVKLAHPVAGAH